MTNTPDPELLAQAQAQREQSRADAHRILRLDEAPSPAETAALAELAPDRWVLHHAADYINGTIRLLDQRGYLTTPELRAAERQSVIDAHRVFNHVPTAVHRATVNTHHQYIAALEQAVKTLAEQLDTVGALAPVRRTKAGQTAAAETARIRDGLGQARRAWITPSTPSAPQNAA